MKHIITSLILTILLLLTTELSAQQAQRIAYIYPAGGQQGTTFEIIIGGRRLPLNSKIFVSGKGVTARAIQASNSFRLNESVERSVIRDYFAETVQRLYPDRSDLFGMYGRVGKVDPTIERPSLESVQKKRFWLDMLAPGAAPEMEQRVLLQRFYYEYFTQQPDRFLPDPVGGMLRVEVTIAPDAAPGFRELVVSSQQGLTAPYPFQITPVHEVTEIEPNNTAFDFINKMDKNGTPIRPYEAENPDAVKPLNQSGKPKKANQQNQQNKNRPLDWALIQLPPQQLPVVFNGQIRAGDIDRFEFNAKKGEKLVFVTWGRMLSPYLADGVPGWFSPVLTLFDPAGKKIATADSWRFDPDPILLLEAPKDGKYTLQVQDALYRGRADFVYRIVVGTFPFVTSASSVGIVKEGAPILLKGWNLPVDQVVPPVAVSDADKAKGKQGPRRDSVRTVSSLRGQWLPSPVRFPGGILPVVEENQLRKGTSDEAPLVKLPVIIEGKILKPNEQDTFSFQGKKGTKIVLDLTAIGFGSTLDGRIELLDDLGKVLAFNDDRADENGPNIGLETHHADPCLLAELPKDGTYRVRVYDVLNKGGESCVWRLRVSPARPDFAVYGTPSSVTCRGNNVTMEFIVVRKDGFNGDITVRAEKESGMKVWSGTIPASLDRIKSTLEIDEKITEPNFFKLTAVAKINGKDVVRSVIPADTMEQAFIYFHQVPRQTFRVVKPWNGPIRAVPTQKEAVSLSFDKSSTVTFELLSIPRGMELTKQDSNKPKAKPANTMDFSVETPNNVTVEDWKITDKKLTLTLKTTKPDDPHLAIPEKGSIIFNIIAGWKNPKAPKGKKAVMSVRDSLPAVPYLLNEKK